MMPLGSSQSSINELNILFTQLFFREKDGINPLVKRLRGLQEVLKSYLFEDENYKRVTEPLCPEIYGKETADQDIFKLTSETKFNPFNKRYEVCDYITKYCWDTLLSSNNANVNDLDQVIETI